MLLLIISFIFGVNPAVFAGANPYEEGLNALHAGDYDRAIKAFTYTLETIPHDYEALSNRGVAWFHKAVYDRAIDDATRALEINPYYSVGANQLAWMLATCPDPRFRDGQRAVALAEKVVQRFPEANFMDTLAAAYAEAGNLDAAVHVQQMAVQRLRNNLVAGDKTSFEKRLNRYGQSAVHSRTKKTTDPRTAARTVARVDVHDTAGPVAAADPVPSMPKGTASSDTAGKPADAGHGDDQRYSVHLFSFRNEKWADEKAHALARGRYPAFICPTHIGGDPVVWFRVYAGAFGHQEAARDYARELKRDGHEWAQVVLLPVQASMVTNRF